MLRSIAVRKDPATGAGALDVAWLTDAVGAAGLVVVLITVSLASPGPASGGARSTGIAVTIGLSATGLIVWMLARRNPWVVYGSLSLMSAAGGVLAGLSWGSAAVAVPCAATFSAGARLRIPASLTIVIRTLIAFVIAARVVNAPTGVLLGYPFAFAGLWGMGLTRHVYSTRAEQAERMLAETRRAHEAETHAAALAERARIARDIHDVLAHSLAAVSVNLQAAEGLLAAGTLTAESDIGRAMECIERAGTWTREGMAAARRAVLALRDDAAPLAEQLSSLADRYRAVGDVSVDFTITGAVRPVSAEASQAAQRAAQEALTNARKHAPGQPVMLSLRFEPEHITVAVVNPLPPRRAQGPLANTGAGYGLAGLRERAALAGGTLEAGSAAGTWQVSLRIPT